jgi:hypothetical protein
LFFPGGLPVATGTPIPLIVDVVQFRFHLEGEIFRNPFDASWSEMGFTPLWRVNRGCGGFGLE